MENAILLKDLTDQERMMFQVEYSSMRKDTGVGVLLAIFWVPSARITSISGG